jgi:hypothetical protein
VADVNATLRFLMACLACAGAVPWLSLTAYGMAQLPLELLRVDRGVRDFQLAESSEVQGLLAGQGGDSGEEEEGPGQEHEDGGAAAAAAGPQGEDEWWQLAGVGGARRSPRGQGQQLRGASSGEESPPPSSQRLASGAAPPTAWERQQAAAAAMRAVCQWILSPAPRTNPWLAGWQLDHIHSHLELEI